MAVAPLLAHNRRVPLSLTEAPGNALSASLRDRLLAADPAATFFHTPTWTDALLAAYPYYRFSWIAARDAAGHLAGALPVMAARRFGVTQLLSLPYGTYGGPLAAGATAEERDRVREALVADWRRRARAAGVGRAELVLGPAPGEPPPAVEGSARERQPRETQVVDLSVGFERLWSAVVEGDVRTGCRKAEKSGVTVRAGAAPGDAALLDRLYREQAAGWRNHTPFPEGFLADLLARGTPAAGAPDTPAGGRVEAWFAERDGAPLAAQLVLLFRTTAISWLAPNTPDARRWNAPTLLYVRLMEALAARGVALFDLGGSPGNPGLAAFKAGLGGRPAAYDALRVEAGWFRPLHRLQYRLRGIEE